MKTPETFLELIEKYRVEIPLLQRDYVQGRNDAKTQALRDNFVSSLFDALEETKALELDFIYGPAENGVFIPLDGQQRLTTLFLLHWYIAKRENKCSSNFKKFIYKVRTTTQEFLDALLNTEQGGKLEISTPPLAEIKDAAWYYSAWDVDPSIQGMMKMLDSIHSRYGTEKKELWGKLERIRFNLLNMEEFGLTDDLYMKMNARGVPLTDFENFKAWLEQAVTNADLSLQENWKKKTDKDWCDLFFKFAGENMDDAYLRFFKTM